MHACLHAWAHRQMLSTQEDGEHQHDERVTSVAFEVPGECDGHRLNAWLSMLLREKGEDLFRSKGILSIQRSPEKCAHGLFEPD